MTRGTGPESAAVGSAKVKVRSFSPVNWGLPVSSACQVHTRTPLRSPPTPSNDRFDIGVRVCIDSIRLRYSAVVHPGSVVVFRASLRGCHRSYAPKCVVQVQDHLAIVEAARAVTRPSNTSTRPWRARSTSGESSLPSALCVARKKTRWAQWPRTISKGSPADR